MFRRRGRGKRRHRYAVIDEDEDDKLESMEMLPKGGKRLEGFVPFAAGISFANLSLKYVQEAACAGTAKSIIFGLHIMITSLTSKNIFSIDCFSSTNHA